MLMTTPMTLSAACLVSLIVSNSCQFSMKTCSRPDQGRFGQGFRFRV